MSNTFIPRAKAAAPQQSAAAAASADAKQGTGAKDHEERLQLLGRLSEKLLSNREFEERERYITELARQEAEIEHLRNLVGDQARKIQEQDAYIKTQEAQMEQLRQGAARGGGGGGPAFDRLQAEQALQLQQLRAELADKDRQIERLSHAVAHPPAPQPDPRVAAELSAAREKEAHLSREVSSLHTELSRLRGELEAARSQQAAGHNKSFAAPPKSKRDDEVLLEEIPEEPEYRIEPAPAPAPPSRPIPDEF